MAKILKIALLVLVVAGLMYWFYQRGGEQPVETIEEPVAIPAASDSAQ